MPIQGDAVLTNLREEIQEAVGMTNDLGFTFRFRRYEPGESHRAHLDQFEMAGRLLVATAILYLTDTERGGETSFPKALPKPVCIGPQMGRLSVWQNYRADGSVEHRALHESLPVEEGVKATVTYFVYRKIEECADVLAAIA